MYKISKLIDVSCWTGRWPFIDLRNTNFSGLEEKLKSVGVTRAFVAPLEGILEQDPRRANKALYQAVKNNFFSPVPIIDMSYANWKENAAAALNDGRVLMVKLLPNYHMYGLCEVEMDSLVALTSPRGIVVSIQTKMEDPRAQYPLMKISNVKFDEIRDTLTKFPEQNFILNCMTFADLPEDISPYKNVYFDISCIETQDTLAAVNKKHTLERFLFASHSPLHFPEGSVNKLKYADLGDEEIDKPAYKNAEKLFKF